MELTWAGTGDKRIVMDETRRTIAEVYKDNAAEGGPRWFARAMPGRGGLPGEDDKGAEGWTRFAGAAAAVVYAAEQGDIG